MTCQSGVKCKIAKQNLPKFDLSITNHLKLIQLKWPLGILQTLPLKLIHSAHFSIFKNMWTSRIKKNSSRVFCSCSEQKYISQKYLSVVPVLNSSYLTSLTTSARKCNGWELRFALYSVLKLLAKVT